MAHDSLTAEIASGHPLVALSPHLDDGVLSCGALLLRARLRAPVTVVSFFTEAAPPPYTLSGRQYLRQTRASDAEALYASRRDEDRAVMTELGAAWRHFGLVDGLFRRKDGRAPRSGGLAGRLPEIDHVYPTYRLHLSRGRVSRHDAGTVRAVADAIAALLPSGRGLVLAPLGVGGHADHVLVRTAAELSGRRVAYYSDFPYNLRSGPDASFTGRHAFTACAWEDGLAEKRELIRGYRTQADALFPQGSIPLVPEVFLLPASVPAAPTPPRGGGP
ncbi:PIG-L family deacetylase [Streptomyces sp. Je 1-79]|uniref:PIG-L deacetylase family protein n=1 Tax=Streptomyces sp. Je 1-79 TaxID=2943847 RepID=UPI0021A31C00|nr:PIG-L family deacetylase [Streptomyces sp. Je 1-79]MCT4354022.1 PIG-L family deacetylase [Streptomyces sp. Je 1-79]